MNELPILIIGAGGHGRVVADTLRAAGRFILGFLDASPAAAGRLIDGLKVLGGDDLLGAFVPASVRLANGVGSVTAVDVRRRIYEEMVAAGYTFDVVRHPSAVISLSAVLGAGVQVMAGAILQPGVTLGDNTIVNTGVLVDHDCCIGRHCHLAPGAVLSGGVAVGDGCHIGTAAAVRQGVRIGDAAFIAAGAMIVNDVERGGRVAGVPGRPMRTA